MQASMVEGDKRDDTSSSAAVREQGNVSLQCPKLTETNYTTWALMMETILKAYVAQYTTAKEVWNSIKVKHLGADLVQKARLQTLRSELETLKMKPHESTRRITAFEERLKSQDEPENNYQNKLLLASSNNQGGGRGHGRNFTKNKNSYGKGTSRGSIDKSKLRCYECGKHGHFAKECTKWKYNKTKKEESHLIYDTGNEPTLL
ncbi:zinc finger, CCHC-type containing protein [Tanacetum coccineum]